MNIRIFIDRPLLSGVISVFIVIVGVISLLTLPVEKYPDIAPPTIYVTATYPGASAEALQKSVVAPLEEAINGVENMIYMTSSASNSGLAEIYVYFAHLFPVRNRHKFRHQTVDLPKFMSISHREQMWIWQL